MLLLCLLERKPVQIGGLGIFLLLLLFLLLPRVIKFRITFVEVIDWKTYFSGDCVLCIGEDNTSLILSTFSTSMCDEWRDSNALLEICKECCIPNKVSTM